MGSYSAIVQLSPPKQGPARDFTIVKFEHTIMTQLFSASD
jgi:hypothetical protein